MTNIQHLYKYGTLTKYTKSLFAPPQLYLCAADQLNDPFECRPVYTFDGSESEIIASFARGALGTGIGQTEHQAIALATKSYREGKHRDPATLSQLRKNFMDMSTRRVGIYCLTEVPDSILMWSHYAAGHSGFCIEFAASDSTPFFGEAQKVNYLATYPIVDHFKMDGSEKIDRVFLTKHLGWSCEREWRILGNVKGPGHYEYPAALMTRVIFGLSASETLKRKIMDWSRRRTHPVGFAQAVRGEMTFSIDIRPL